MSRFMKQRAVSHGDTYSDRDQSGFLLMMRFPVAAAAAVALTACIAVSLAHAGAIRVAQAAAQPDAKAKAAKPPVRPVLPTVELSEQLMFKLMIAEVAEQRGQPQVAVLAYLE